MSTLVRGSVKADNSCLFAAITRLCEDITSEFPLKNAARHLRRLVSLPIAAVAPQYG